MITRQQIEDSLAALLPGNEPIPPGWMTCHEIGKTWGLRPSQTRHRLLELTRAGRIPPSRLFRVRINNVIRPIPYYYVLPK